MKKLSHINEENKPQMVDVSKKDESSRVACAQTVVVFPEALSAWFKDGDIKTKKGPNKAINIIITIIDKPTTADLFFLNVCIYNLIFLFFIFLNLISHTRV